jgi:hypothetical protein
MDEDYDGVQYDTFYAPDPMQIEAEAIRRECQRESVNHIDYTIVVSPY